MSSLDNLASRHAEFSDSLLFRSVGNTSKQKGKIPPVKPTLPTTNRGVSRQEDSERQKSRSLIWDDVSIVPPESSFRPQVAFRESSKSPGVIELEIPSVNELPITLFGERKRKKRVVRRIRNNFDKEVKYKVSKKPSRSVSKVSDISIRTKENVEERVYSDPERKVPTYMFASMSFVSFCIAAKHVDYMFGELPSAMGDPGVVTDMERQLEAILMYEVFEDAAVIVGAPGPEETPQYGLQPELQRSPGDMGSVGIAFVALVALASWSTSDDSSDDD